MALTNLTKVQTVGIGSNIEVVGVVTTGQFKSGTSNLHSTGIELTNLNVSGIATIGGNLSVGGVLTYEDVTNIDSIGIITARAGVNVSGGQLDVGSNIKIGNAGVITATSLRVGGIDSDIANSSADEAIFGRTDSGDTGITIFTGSGSTGRIFFGDGHGSAADRAGTINYSHLTNDMSFGTSGNNERLRITSDGRVVINKTSGDYDGALHVKAISENAITIEGTNAAINWRYQNGSAGYRGGIKWHQNGLVKFDAGIAGNTYYYSFNLNAAERLRIDSNGYIKLSGRNVQGSANGDKLLRIYQPSRTDAEEDVLLLQSYNTSSANSIIIGGGDSSYNAATDISFRTAAVNTTSGTERVNINSNGIQTSEDIFINVRGKGFNTSDWSIANTTSGNALSFTGGAASTEKFRIDSTGKLRFAVTNVQIELQTSDGSDNGFLNLSGGGACSAARGAQVICYGNEYTSHQGRLQLLAGQSGNANGTIDFYTSGSKKATINDSGCLHIGNVGYGDKNYMLDVEGGIACEGSGGGTGRYGTIYSNFGGDSGGRQCGAYTIHSGQMSMHGTGNRYMHIKFDMPAGAMWYMKIEGYEYNGNWTSTVNGATVGSDKVHYSLSGGYIYSGQAMFNGKAKAHRGITPTWYLHGNDLCVYIDTVSTGTGNRWGFYRFSGGHDGIVGRSAAQPIAIVAYSFSSGTSNPF